jgi:(4S)-4-hydroxy-5-phosphonooxypentane-2,3-dione isomerase
MLVLQVLARVKPEYLEAFKEATITNARASRKEPGVARFDLLQQEDEPLRFQLIEVYRTRGAIAAHKETPHYRQWVETVTPMMAEARSRSSWTTVYPEDAAY